MDTNWSVRTEATPNPNTLKFNLGSAILETPVDFPDASQADRSPLASKIFGFPWAAGVYLGKDFVTITKQEWVDWDVLADPLAGLIEEHLKTGEMVLLPQTEEPEIVETDDSPDVTLIKQVINDEVRPAVAMDGGDIVFHKYEENIVYVYLRGACAGCPSSMMTLKNGVETRLKEVVPQIKEVVSL